MMTDEHAKTKFLINELEQIEATLRQLAKHAQSAVNSIAVLNRYGSAPPTVISVDGLYGLMRGRLHELGLEPLLQRTSHATDETWVNGVANRLGVIG